MGRDLIFGNRSSTCEIHSRSKRACGIRISCSTSLDVTTPPSTLLTSCHSQDSPADKWWGRNFSYEDVHVEGTQRIAEAVAKYDCDRFIQVSCYNADLNSPSEYNRTKVC